MIIEHTKKLVFIATPKTATTSIEAALLKTSLVSHMAGPLKHITFEDYLKLKVALQLDEYISWAVIRHPREKFISWFRYRSRAELKGHRRYLGHRTLSEHILTCDQEFIDSCDNRKHIEAKGKRSDIIFRHEEFAEVKKFMALIYPDISIKKLNASPGTKDFSPELLKQIDGLLEEQINWYESIETDTCDSASAALQAAQREAVSSLA